MSFLALDLITDAAKELGVVAQGETLSAGDAKDLLSKLTRLFDNWNAEREAVFASRKWTFTMTAGLNPHTIGPIAATWTVDQRPVEIDAAHLVIDKVRYQLTIHRDAKWYQDLVLPELSISYPSGLWYNAVWPNGELYFYPVPSVARVVELYLRIVLAELALNDVVSMPPGYRDAATLTLAEDCAEMFGRPIPQTLPMRATKARARIFTNNTITPPLDTRDSGLPSGSRVWFDYLQGR